MSKIDELIKKKCNNGVVYKTLDKVCKISKGTQLNKTVLLAEGLYPVINGGILPSGYWDNFNYNENLITISQGGASAGYVSFQLSKFWAGAHCYVVVECNPAILYKYLYHFLKSKESFLISSQIGAGIPSLSLNDIYCLRIPIPPIEIQIEIVKILDSFNDLESNLESELEFRKIQYKFWRNIIIDKAKGRIGKLIELLSGPVTDGPHITPELVNEGVPFISASAVHEGKIHLEDAQGFITGEFDKECSKKYKPQKWDVYMVKSGSTTGKVAIVDTDANFNIWSPLAAMRADNKITAKYLYYLLQTEDIQEQVQNRMSHGSQPNLSMRVLEQFDVKIPSLDEQNRIVKILDSFDNLINDTSNGLPAEIELRKKQFEYYRKKLLDFKEVTLNE